MVSFWLKIHMPSALSCKGGRVYTIAVQVALKVRMPLKPTRV